jgi:TrmH family RNA methyltransferase
MLSKNKIKYFVSLQAKKARDEEQLYIIEGDKLVKEYLLSGVRFRLLAANPEFVASLVSEEKGLIDEIDSVSNDDLKRISSLKTPHNAIAIVPVPAMKFDPDIILDNLCAALDFVQDPGNLGTIIRSAAWFGIRNIVCSEDSVDLYNPKVIQASMGAIIHVRVHYFNLGQFLGIALKKGLPVYGTMIEGESVYEQKLENKGIILLGNESRGISEELMPFVSKKIMIPRFNNYKYGIDSLNVSMAASIVFSEFARRKRLKA